MIRSILLRSALVLASTAAFAQTAATSPVSAPVPPPPSANDIPLADAVQAAQAAIALCKTNGYNVTVTVMDKDYGIRLVMRADGAGMRTTEIGRRKDYTVLKTGGTSGEHAKKIGPLPRKADGSAPDDPSGDTNMILAQGGVPIRKAGQIVGAFSVSGAPGGDKDEACAAPAVATLEAGLK